MTCVSLFAWWFIVMFPAYGGGPVFVSRSSYYTREDCMKVVDALEHSTFPYQLPPAKQKPL